MGFMLDFLVVFFFFPIAGFLKVKPPLGASMGLRRDFMRDARSATGLDEVVELSGVIGRDGIGRDGCFSLSLAAPVRLRLPLSGVMGRAMPRGVVPFSLGVTPFSLGLTPFSLGVVVVPRALERLPPFTRLSSDAGGSALIDICRALMRSARPEILLRTSSAFFACSAARSASDLPRDIRASLLILKLRRVLAVLMLAGCASKA
jgi:hypothetical protein